jgi:hypothetical protein
LIDRGFVPGPTFGKILEDIRERQASGMLKNRPAALLYLESLKGPESEENKTPL